MTITPGFGAYGPDSFIYADRDGDDLQVNTRTAGSGHWPDDAVVVVSSSGGQGTWLTCEQARHLADVLRGDATLTPAAVDAVPARRAARFEPVPDQARDAGAAGLVDTWSGWDADTECDAPLAEHDHDLCYPMAWWPDRAAVAAAVVRGLADAGWTLTPPGEQEVSR